MTSDEIFLKFSADKLQQWSGRIQDCLGKLSEEQIWTRKTENENAIGNLVLHLCGNLRQWIGTGVAGQPDIRKRDAEFAARGNVTATELKQRLHETVRAMNEIIRSVPPARFTEPVSTQDYQVTVLESIYHVVEHFAYHAGQILLLTKLLTGQDLGYYRHLTQAKHTQTIP